MIATTVNAAEVNDPYINISLEKDYDGTGQGTIDGTFINTENGFVPGDDTPDDGVVASDDFVGYTNILSFQPGPARTINVKYQFSDYLQMENSSLTNLCVSNKFITGTFTGTPSTPQCSYEVERGTPVEIKQIITLKAKDSAGTIKEGQSLRIYASIQDNANGKIIQAVSDPVTVVSAPLADIVVKPQNCYEYGTCRPVNHNQTTGEIRLIPEKMFYDGYNNTKGASILGPWEGQLDISSFPEGTTWKVNNQDVVPTNGFLPVSQTTNEAVIEFVVPDSNWGGDDFEEGETRRFDIQFIPSPESFSTESYWNNGDGWEPGIGEGKDFDTSIPANNRNSRARKGFVYPNNDWSAIQVYNPFKPTGPALATLAKKKVYRPYDNKQTLWSPGNTSFESGKEVEAFANLPLSNAKYHYDDIALGTEIRTDLILDTSAIENIGKFSVSDQWLAHQIEPTGPATFIDSSTLQEVESGYVIQWSKNGPTSDENGTYQPIEDVADITKQEGWITSKNPIPGANSVRIIFDEDFPRGQETGGAYVLQIPMKVISNNYDEITDYSLTQRINGEIYSSGQKTLYPVETEIVKPAFAEPQQDGVYLFNPTSEVIDRKNNEIHWKMTPVVENLADSTTLIHGKVELSIDACIKDLQLEENSMWEIENIQFGTGCGSEEKNMGKATITPKDGVIRPTSSDPMSGKSFLSPINAVATVSNASIGAIPFVGEFYLQGLSGGNISLNGELLSETQNKQIDPNQGGTTPDPAYGSGQSIAEPIQVTLASLKGPDSVEIKSPISWEATVASMGEDGSYASETVFVLPGKGNDRNFLNQLKAISGNDSYDGPTSSRNVGTYAFGGVEIIEGESAAGTKILCTSKTNPTLDPAQANAAWNETCGPGTTAFKVVIPEIENGVGIASIKYSINPSVNWVTSNYLAWMGPVTPIDGSPATVMAWPDNTTTYSSSISGKIYWDSSGTGKPYTSQDKPIGDIKVSLKDSEGNLIGEKVSSAGGGDFSFTELKAGNYYIEVEQGEEEGQVPKYVPSPFYPDKDINVKLTYSYNKQTGEKASLRSSKIELPQKSNIQNVNFGFSAKDSYSDVSKTIAIAQCDDNEVSCNLAWRIPVQNGGTSYANAPETPATSTSMSNGVVTDVTSKEIYDLEMSIGEEIIGLTNHMSSGTIAWTESSVYVIKTPTIQRFL